MERVEIPNLGVNHSGGGPLLACVAAGKFSILFARKSPAWAAVAFGRRQGDEYKLGRAPQTAARRMKI